MKKEINYLMQELAILKAIVSNLLPHQEEEWLDCSLP
jgi:hypothetical protein